MNTLADKNSGHVVAGIAGFGTYVPKNRVSAQELALQASIPVERLTEGIGFTHIHKANDDEHPFTMGLSAAKDALLDAGINGEDVDLVIFVSAGDYDYRFWCPSSAIIRELGCIHAYSFEVKNGCAGGNLACNIAIGLMERDLVVNTALVICADTLTRVINPEMVECQPLLFFGDGAAAVVLKRNHPRYQLLSFAEHTDGNLADLLRIEAGGTRMPINADFKDWTKTYSKIDASAFSNLVDQVYLKEYLTVIQRAIDRSGHSISDMEFILMNQVKNTLRARILEGIGMTQSHTYISLDEFGHIGPADCLFTMAKAHREGLLTEGKLAILAASGFGFSWAASIIRC